MDNRTDEIGGSDTWRFMSGWASVSDAEFCGEWVTWNYVIILTNQRGPSG